MDERQRRSRTASDRPGNTERPDRQRAQRSQTARGQEIRGQGSRTQGTRSQTGRSQASRNPNRRPQTGRPANRRPSARRPQTKRRRRRNLGIRICLTVILIIAAIAAVFLWRRYSPSKEKADLDKYYGIEQEGQLAIVVNNEVGEPKGMIADGKAYIQYEIVRDYINSRFYWDPNENILLYTLPKDMVSVEVGSKDYTVSKDKNSEDYVILKTEGSTAYIALDFVQQYTNIDYEVYDEPERVVIVGDWGEHTVAAVKKDTQVRYQGGVKSPVLSELKKGDEVTVI